MSEEEKRLLEKLGRLLDEHPEGHQDRNRVLLTQRLRALVEHVEQDVAKAKRWAAST